MATTALSDGMLLYGLCTAALHARSHEAACSELSAGSFPRMLMPVVGCDHVDRESTGRIHEMTLARPILKLKRSAMTAFMKLTL